MKKRNDRKDKRRAEATSRQAEFDALTEPEKVARKRLRGFPYGDHSGDGEGTQ